VRVGGWWQQAWGTTSTTTTSSTSGSGNATTKRRFGVDSSDAIDTCIAADAVMSPNASRA
jgi:hypothetical protein